MAGTEEAADVVSPLPLKAMMADEETNEMEGPTLNKPKRRKVHATNTRLAATQ